MIGRKHTFKIWRVCVYGKYMYFPFCDKEGAFKKFHEWVDALLARGFYRIGKQWSGDEDYAERIVTPDTGLRFWATIHTERMAFCNFYREGFVF